jgi:hypothetical protein
VRELVYDPWRFGQAAQELERRVCSSLHSLSTMRG